MCILSHPTYKFHPEDPLEVDAVPLGHLVAELPRFFFAFLRNIKSKLMDVVALVLFIPNAIAHTGGI